jgi:hypothetical protein
VHGSKESMPKLQESFQLAHPTAAKAQIKKRIPEIAEKEKHPLGIYMYIYMYVFSDLKYLH